MMAKHTLLSSLSELPLQGLIHRGLEGVTCVCKGLTRLLPEGCEEITNMEEVLAAGFLAACPSGSPKYP